MKFGKIALAALAASLCLCACGVESGGAPVSSKPSEVVSEDVTSIVSSAPEVSEEESEPEVSEPISSVEAQPAHSSLYLEGCTQDEAVEYFKEVVLDTEYATGDGDFTLVQKWEVPIHYRIYGEPTETDLARLNKLFAELNQVNGFPGIHEAEEGYVENLSIFFSDEDHFYNRFGEFVNYEPSDGAVQYWYYDDDNSIYTAQIGYRTDIDQETRNSVLPEEIVNGLGIDDTETREDSITYQYYNSTDELSDIDWLIIKLLYHPDIACGMNAEECEQVIRSIYY